MVLIYELVRGAILFGTQRVRLEMGNLQVTKINIKLLDKTAQKN